MQIGIDNEDVHSKQEKPKGIGNSITLSEDCNNIDNLNKILLALAEKVSYRLRKLNLKASVINVQIKTNEFITYSHQKKCNNTIDTTKEIYSIAKELLNSLYKGQLIRLIGLRVDSLTDNSQEQLNLFEISNKKNQLLENAMDKIKDKYGYNSITLARKLDINNISKD